MNGILCVGGFLLFDVARNSEENNINKNTNDNN